MRRALPWRRRVLSDTVTAGLWGCWIWLCVQGSGLARAHAGSAHLAGPPVASFFAIAKCLVMAIGSCGALVLWRILTNRGRDTRRADPSEAKPIHADIPQVCVVHHDAEGHILAIEPQHHAEPVTTILPVPPAEDSREDTTIDLPRAA